MLSQSWTFRVSEKKKNKIVIEDDRYTQYIDRAEKAGLISTRVLND